MIRDFSRNTPFGETYEPWRWTKHNELWAPDKSWQSQIARASEFDCIIFLLRDRIGLELEKSFAPEGFGPAELEQVGQGVVAWPGSILRPGQMPLTGTTFEYLDALHARKKSGDARQPALIVLRRTPPISKDDRRREYLDLAKGQISDAGDTYDTQIANADLFAKTFIGPHLAYETNRQFLAQLEYALRKHLGLDDAPIATLNALKPYDVDDAAKFFGRSGPASEIIDAIVATLSPGGTPAFHVIHGESGVGKSSLMRAGVLGGLKRMPREPYEVVLFDVSVADAANPVAAFAEAIRKTVFPAQSAVSVAAEADLGANQASRVHGWIRRSLGALSSSQRLVVALDQMEVAADSGRPGPTPDQWAQLFTLLSLMVHERTAAAVMTIPSNRLEQLRTVVGVDAGAMTLHPLLPVGPKDVSDIVDHTTRRMKPQLPEDYRVKLHANIQNFVSTMKSGDPILPLVSLTMTRLLDALGEAAAARRKEDAALWLKGDQIGTGASGAPGRRASADTRTTPPDSRRRETTREDVVDASSARSRSSATRESDEVAIAEDLMTESRSTDSSTLAQPEAGKPVAPLQNSNADLRISDELLSVERAINAVGESVWETVFPKESKRGEIETYVQTQSFDALCDGLIDISLGVRKPLDEEQATSDGTLKATVDNLIKELKKRWLIVPQDKQIRLAHDTVIRFWDRMAQWLSESQQVTANLGSIAKRAAKWRQAQAIDQPDYLLRAMDDLREAMDVFARYHKKPDRISQDVRAFVRASVLTRDLTNRTDLSGAKPWLWSLAEAGEGDWIGQMLERLEKHGTHVAQVLAARDDVFRSTALLEAAEAGLGDVVNKMIALGAETDVQQVDGISAVHAAARHQTVGHLTALSALISGGANLELRDRNGASPLSLAAEYGHRDVITRLLDGGADIESRDDTGLTPLNIASRVSDVETISLLLSRQADIDTASNEGWTPLLSALSSQQPKLAMTLIEAGANVKARNKHNETVLHYAAIHGYADLIAILLGKGAEIGVVNTAGWTAAQLAMAHNQREAVEALLKGGANASAMDPDGYTLTLSALARGLKDLAKDLLTSKSATELTRNGSGALHAAAASNVRDLIDMVVATRAVEVNSTDKNGSTPLHYCATYGCPASAARLIQAGAKVDAMDLTGQTPLHHAAYALSTSSEDLVERRREMVRILLDHRASAKAVTPLTKMEGSQATPLHYLARYKGESGAELVARLVNEGAAIDARLADGRTPLHVAASAGATTICGALLDAKASRLAQDDRGATALHYAAFAGRLDVVERLGTDKNDVSVRALSGQTPLHWAANAGHVEVIKALLRAGASDEPDADNSLPLHHACREGRVDAVRDFCQRLRSTNDFAAMRAVNRFGETPLHLAVIGGHLECAHALLHVDPDYPLSATSANGRSHLHYAVMQKEPKDQMPDRRAEVVQLLLSKGADVDQATTSGTTPLHEATTRNALATVEVLLGAGAKAMARDASGETALIKAVDRGLVDMAQLLLSHGANPDDARPNGETVVYVAASRGDAQLFDTLLAGGAALKGEAKDGALLEAAIEGGNQHVFETILTRDPRSLATCKTPSTLLVKAVEGGSEWIVAWLIRNRANISGVDEHGATALHKAAETGRSDLVALLIAHGAQVNRAQTDGQTPLHLAALDGHIEALRTLIANGAAIDSLDKGGATPLIQAIEGRHVEAARLLLDGGASVNAKNADGYTALHVAAYVGDVPLMQMLLERGADREAAPDVGFTPLFAAAHSGKREAVELLLASPADVKRVAHDGYTLLMAAAESGSKDTVAFLLERGIGVEDRREGGQTALAYAAEKGHAAVAQQLLDAGADPNSATQGGMTPLITAATEGHEEVVRALVQHKDIRVDLPCGEITAFMAAAAKGHASIAKLLLDNGAMLERINSTGTSSLQSASTHGNEDVVRLLIDRGADINRIRSSDGASALILAAGEGRTGVVRYLISKGAKIDQDKSDGRTALMQAARFGETEIATMLLDAGADPELVDSRNQTPLMLTASYGHTETARLLLARGSNLERESDGGWSALTLAAANNRVATMLFLIEQGAVPSRLAGENWTAVSAAARYGRAEAVTALLDLNPELLNQQARDGTTALTIASDFGHENVVDLLLRRGASPQLTGPGESSPLVLAAAAGHPGVVNSLLRAGAEVDQPTDEGGTALMLAVSNSHSEIVKTLLDNGADPRRRTRDGLAAIDYVQGENAEEIKRLLSQRIHGVQRRSTTESFPGRAANAHPSKRSPIWTLVPFVLLAAAAGGALWLFLMNNSP